MRDAALEEEEHAYLSAGSRALRTLPSSMLTDPVATLVSRPAICVLPSLTVGEAIARMKEEHIGCLLVTEDGKLAGIFTERDVLCRIVTADDDVRSAAVGEFMTPEPASLPMDATVAHALLEMSLGGFRHVPLVDPEGRPVRIVSVKDIVEFIVDFFSAEVLTLPPDSSLTVPASREGA